nr:chemotaxis-specific protein-glutamate methyltransferase CheB [candidate division Zixibacteria bacterium]
MDNEVVIRVLIIDQSLHYRDIFRKALGGMSGVEIVGEAVNSVTAADRVNRLRPDLVVLDFELAGSATKELIENLKKIHPNLDIILVSRKLRTSGRSSVKALDLGALYFVRKPERNSIENDVKYFRKYFGPVINLYHVTSSTARVCQASSQWHQTRESVQPRSKADRAKLPEYYDILAIGCSLGGPEALYRFIAELPADFPIPVVIVQHMPTGFTTMLSMNLDAKSKLIVKEAQHGEQLRSGYVYLAPGGRHLKIKGNSPGIYRAVLDDGPEVNGCKPAVDVLYFSLADSFCGNILAVVLTGMGSDGFKGVRAMKNNGNCFCITQSKSSCVVYGMPAAIEEAGLSDLSLTIEQMAAGVVAQVTKQAVKSS